MKRSNAVEIIAIPGIPLVRKDDDLVALIGDGLAFGTLPHHERRCSSDLVRVSSDADLKLAAKQIGRATRIHQ